MASYEIDPCIVAGGCGGAVDASPQRFAAAVNGIIEESDLLPAEIIALLSLAIAETAINSLRPAKERVRDDADLESSLMVRRVRAVVDDAAATMQGQTAGLL